MAKYVYPAVFSKEEEGYSIIFPDIEGCYTCGSDLIESMDMAEDALALMLYHFEEENYPIPVSTPIDKVSIDDNSFVTYISCDTLVYRKRNNNRSIKKTLSIPAWLNDIATNAGVNFSQILQEALRKQLNV